MKKIIIVVWWLISVLTGVYCAMTRVEDRIPEDWRGDFLFLWCIPTFVDVLAFLVFELLTLAFLVLELLTLPGCSTKTALKQKFLDIMFLAPLLLNGYILQNIFQKKSLRKAVLLYLKKENADANAAEWLKEQQGNRKFENVNEEDFLNAVKQALNSSVDDETKH